MFCLSTSLHQLEIERKKKKSIAAAGTLSILLHIFTTPAVKVKFKSIQIETGNRIETSNLTEH